MDAWLAVMWERVRNAELETIALQVDLDNITDRQNRMKVEVEVWRMLIEEGMVCEVS